MHQGGFSVNTSEILSAFLEKCSLIKNLTKRLVQQGIFFKLFILQHKPLHRRFPENFPILQYQLFFVTSLLVLKN